MFTLQQVIIKTCELYFEKVYEVSWSLERFITCQKWKNCNYCSKQLEDIFHSELRGAGEISIIKEIDIEHSHQFVY